MDNQMKENVHGQQLMTILVYTGWAPSVCLTKSIKYLQSKIGPGLSVIVLLH